MAGVKRVHLIQIGGEFSRKNPHNPFSDDWRTLGTSDLTDASGDAIPAPKSVSKIDPEKPVQLEFETKSEAIDWIEEAWPDATSVFRIMAVVGFVSLRATVAAVSSDSSPGLPVAPPPKSD